MPQVVVRAFKEADEARVIELWTLAGLVRAWNDPKKDISRKLKVQRELFLVAELQGVIVGTVMAGYDGHRGWVNYLAVDVGQRRRGIGTALVRDAERRLRLFGCPRSTCKFVAKTPMCGRSTRRSASSKTPPSAWASASRATSERPHRSPSPARSSRSLQARFRLL